MLKKFDLVIILYDILLTYSDPMKLGNKKHLVWKKKNRTLSCLLFFPFVYFQFIFLTPKIIFREFHHPGFFFISIWRYLIQKRSPLNSVVLLAFRKWVRGFLNTHTKTVPTSGNLLYIIGVLFSAFPRQTPAFYYYLIVIILIQKRMLSK